MGEITKCNLPNNLRAGDIITVNDNGMPYKMILAYSKDYAGGNWSTTISNNIKSTTQTETDVIGNDDKLKSLKTKIDRDKNELLIEIQEVDDSVEQRADARISATGWGVEVAKIAPLQTQTANLRIEVDELRNEIGDMVLYISFPTPANVASNARLSVDGGSNYYNIQFSGDNLIGDNVKGKYLSLVFNGTIFEALGFKSYIVAVLTTNKTGVNNNPLKLPVQLKSKFGSKFSVSNGGILIGEGVKKIKVSAQTYVTTLGSTGIKKALVYNGSKSVEIDALANLTNGYVTISIPAVSIDVTPGNIIYLYCQGSLNDVWLGNGSAQYNRIYIEEII